MLRRGFGLSWLIPVGVLVIGLCMSLLHYSLLSAHDDEQTRFVLHTEAEGVAKLLETRFGGRSDSLGRMAERWARQRDLSLEQWDADVRAYERDVAGFRYIAWLDASCHQRWAVPEVAAMSDDWCLDAGVKRVVELVRAQQRVATSMPIDHDGNSEFLVAAPIRVSGGELLGVVVAAVKIPEAAEAMVRDISGLVAVSFFDGDRRIFGDAAEVDSLRDAQILPVKFRDTQWQLRVVPREAYREALVSGMPSLALLADLVVTLLIAGLIFLLRAAQRREHELAENGAFQRALLDGTDHAIVASDLTGRITAYNPGAERMLGYSQKEALGTHLPFVSSEDVLAVTTELEKEFGRRMTNRFEVLTLRASRGQSEQAQCNLVRKDGSYVPVLMSVSAMRTQRGLPMGYLLTATDFSARQRAEEELRAAKTAAEAATQTKSDFLARMSHEIRTPMNGIIGMSELALQTQLSVQQRDYIETALSSAKNLLAILNDILDFSKIEAGKLDLEAIPFSLRDLLGQALRTLTVEAQDKGLELLLSVGSEVPDHLIGDPNRLRQVVINLVGNAVKFSTHGNVRVWTGLVRRDEGKAELHFLVSDEGIGIADSKLPHLFNAFDQGDKSTGRQFGGTGLGLAICSQLVALFNGKIWVESKLGAGTQFHFTAILGCEDKPQPLHDGAASVDPTVPAKNDLPELRLLLVDDNAVNRKVGAFVLEKAGQHVLLAENGETALLMAREQSFDAILMDLQMPGLDGLETTRRLRAEESRTGRAKTPVIALTAQAMKGDDARCYAAGMDGYVSKPIDPPSLFGALRAVMRPADVRTIDLPRLLDNTGGDRAALKEVVGLFLIELPDMEKTLAQAMEKKDLLGTERAAHRIRGALLNMRARIGVTEAENIEVEARGGSLAESEERFRSLRKAINELQDEMRSLFR